MKSVPCIAMTGGPCGGKSTAMALIRQKMASFGVTVLVVPELATELFTNGVSPAVLSADSDLWRSLQSEMIVAQISHEDVYARLAQLVPGPVLVVTDRGTKDGEAYIGKEAFDGILHDLDLTQAKVRDERYQAVFHLVSAARGAPQAYTTANNTARRESVSEAASLDQATLAAWQGHRDVVIFPNTRLVAGVEEQIPFEDKVASVLQAACQRLGLPVPSRVEKRFILSPSWKSWRIPSVVTSQNIEQAYLVSPEGVERRIRRVSSSADLSGSLFVYTEKRNAPDGGRTVTESVISARQYGLYSSERDTAVPVVQKVRHTFVWADQYFQLDVSPDGSAILEVTQTVDQEISLPPGVPVAREVSGDVSWTARERARLSW